MPSRLFKKTSLITALTLVTVITGESTSWAASPLAETDSSAAPGIPAQLSRPAEVGEIAKTSKADTPLFTPMSDAAAQGMGCLVATTSSLATAYALGPTELMMLVTGAVIVPTTSSLLFIALGGILGAGACGVGAALTPSVLWATENADGISAEITDGLKTTFKPENAQPLPEKLAGERDAPIRPMNEGEIQGMGCLVGVLGLGAVALATAPTEAVMLAAGGVGVPSSTPLLMMGMLGTLLPAGCTFGSVVSLPLIEAYQNFDRSAIGQKIASMIGWGKATSPAAVMHGGTEESKSTSPGPTPSLTTVVEPRLNVSMREEPGRSVVSFSSNP